jgi:hypothetical protein
MLDNPLYILLYFFRPVLPQAPLSAFGDLKPLSHHFTLHEPALSPYSIYFKKRRSIKA